MFFPAASVSTSLFQAALLVFVSYMQFGWSLLVRGYAVFTIYILLGRENLSESSQFRGLPEAITFRELPWSI